MPGGKGGTTPDTEVSSELWGDGDGQEVLSASRLGSLAAGHNMTEPESNAFQVSEFLLAKIDFPVGSVVKNP